MDTTVLNRYRRFRRETAAPAKIALEWAKNDPAAVYPDIAWGSSAYTTVLGEGTVGRYEIVVKVEHEDDPILMGSFDDTWTEGAVENPKWRNDRWNTSRWYHPMTSIGQHVKALRESGMARHDAYRLATSYVMTEMKRDREPEQYFISVTASRNDIELGDAVVGGFDVPEDNAEEHLIGCALDLIAEAVSMAEDNDPEARDEVLNLAARFLPMDLDEEGSLPCVEIAGVQVYVYFKRGVLTISTHFDTADESVQSAEHTTPVRVVMGGGETVFAAR